MNFITLLKIMEMVFAPTIDVDKLDYLQAQIEEYLETFTHLYPSRPLVPKMHYLVHVSTWIKRYSTCLSNHFVHSDLDVVLCTLKQFVVHYHVHVSTLCIVPYQHMYICMQLMQNYLQFHIMPTTMQKVQTVPAAHNAEKLH